MGRIKDQLEDIKHQNNVELDKRYRSPRRRIEKGTLSEAEYEVLYEAIENHGTPLEEVEVYDLETNVYGDYWIPVKEEYESQVEEAWGRPVELGGWVFTEFEFLISAEEMKQRVDAWLAS